MVTELQRQIYQRKMEKWAEKYPLTAYMLFTKNNFEEKVKYAEKLYT